MLVVIISLALVAAAAIVVALALWSRIRAVRRERDDARRANAAAIAARDAAQQEAVERARESRALAEQIAQRIDADVLWQLERERSERTWRHSVAIGPTTTSVFDGVDDVLREALQVELDAAREEVGCVVDLHADLPPNVTAAASLLTLRSAQELLARAVKAADKTTLRVRTDGEDLIITIHPVDADDAPVAVEPLAIPASPDIEPTDGGVRIVDAIGTSP